MAQSRRILTRSKSALLLALTMMALYCVFLRSQSLTYMVHPLRDAIDLANTPLGTGRSASTLDQVPLNDGPRQAKSTTEKNKAKLEEERRRAQFEAEYRELAYLPGTGAIYGKTLPVMADSEPKKAEYEAQLRLATSQPSFTTARWKKFNPYPDYQSREWSEQHAGEFVPCQGPTGKELDDITVFPGRPRGFPDPSFGSYHVLNIDQNVCYDRDGRLGLYGLHDPKHFHDTDGYTVDWNNVDWGNLQTECVARNQGRFTDPAPPNTILSTAYGGSTALRVIDDDLAAESSPIRRPTPADQHNEAGPADSATPEKKKQKKLPRTAVLLRSYTGKDYTNNDKQVIRALVTELGLKTGGQYEVFLLVQEKHNYDILHDASAYTHVVETQIPREFWNMTILWNEAGVHMEYPDLGEEVSTVHNAQWRCLQRFVQEHREFEYVWNWEMDSRVTGQLYDVLTKIGDFARAQPRKGLWERNERFYIPSVHGDYDIDFRREVEVLTLADDNNNNSSSSVWGAPALPFIHAVGPRPPTEHARDDDYEWGMGEEADLITLSPIFNPVGTNWILRNQVWNFNDSQHASTDLPRRATIVTQARVSRRLLDVMHVENQRGNHVGSEMAPATLALLHGLKAVYAPIPVYFDRAWPGASLARWFNGGPRGDSGGPDSAMGWGREGRYQGSTWYYRAVPPQRLYNNWMGYEDTGVGGTSWESIHGRPCLPAMLLHPIKDVSPTRPGTSSDSRLPYS